MKLELEAQSNVETSALNYIITAVTFNLHFLNFFFISDGEELFSDKEGLFSVVSTVTFILFFLFAYYGLERLVKYRFKIPARIILQVEPSSFRPRTRSPRGTQRSRSNC